MSIAALDPQPHPAQAAEAASEIIARTRGLFALLVATCDGSRRSARRLTGADERTLDALRVVPNVDFVSRLGLALGLDTRATAGIVGTSPSPHRSAAALRDDIVAADLHDDAHELDRLAAELGRTADQPSDLGLAQLVLGRAAISRGDVVAAANAVELTLAIGIAIRDRAVVGTLAGSIAQEAMLGTPWGQPGARVRGAEHLAWVAACAGEGAPCEIGATRDRAWRLAAQWCRGHLADADAVGEFHRELDHCSDVRSLAWCASIAALAALRAPHQPGTIRLIVCSQLAIDEAIGASSGPARQLLLARRARVTLGEWSHRARAGEIDSALIDDADSAELTCARMRLSLDETHNNFFHSHTSTLDASSSHGWMRGLVPTLHAMGAVAGSRSEDPC